MSITYSELRLDLASALALFLEPEEASAESLRWFEDGLGWDRTKLASRGDETVPTEARHQVGQWLRRRREGEPWAYIIGFETFRGRRFEVTRDTLIPRPESELTLDAALETGRTMGLRRACDIGTGSGILGICLALETDWQVTASDISPGALEVARRNAAKLGAPIQFALGDLLAPIPDPLELVVSNPPYVDPADASTLQRELSFEPAQALFSEGQGLALSTEILRQAAERQARAVVLEIGAGQSAELMARAKAFGWKQAEARQDWAGHDRILIATDLLTA
ncbi:MAG: peptide chain release factor N(5)-glutamine methyltransferase [Acidobacteriota bacterium]|nr:peptide chain release factor N(5)-glutamine methyltransferase [Acidobacteriota bacterium]